jgi:hypothetical protein
VAFGDREFSQLIGQVRKTLLTLATSALARVAIFADPIFSVPAHYTRAVDFLRQPVNTPLARTAAGLGMFGATAAIVAVVA